MTTLARPLPGGEWKRDPLHTGLAHRAGHPWHAVQLPRRWHGCTPQSALVWTEADGCTHGIQWCACGGLALPYSEGRWLAHNIRRRFDAADLPVWHRDVLDLVPSTGRSVPPEPDAPRRARAFVVLDGGLSTTSRPFSTAA